MKAYSEEELRLAHQSTALTVSDIKEAKLMACFHCCKVFLPARVIGFIQGDDHSWAHCPFCGVDAVITDKDSEFIDAFLLTEMRERWFS